MSETGFGSPSYTPAPLIFDAGFGSPYNTQGRDTGFGSPFDFSLIQTTIANNLFYIGDDGGVRIDIRSTWNEFISVQPPAYSNKFKVTFEKGGVRTLALPAFVGHPVSRAGYVYTNLAQTELHAYVPPLELGLYNIEIDFFFDNTHIKKVINGAFEVIKRNRALGQYTLRSLLPAHFEAGVRNFSQDDLADKDYTTLETLTRSLGQMLQNLTGKPLTKNTLDFNDGDTTVTVETTLGFPSKGDLFLAGVHLKYTGKTNTTFTGVSFASERKDVIAKNSKVVYYDNPYK